jgi:hypothetical protein
MSTATQNAEMIIGVNHLAFDCEIDGGPCYKLGNQELVNGCALSDAISDGWEECEAADENIVIQTPGLDEHGWVADLNYYCQLYRKLDADNSGNKEGEFIYTYQELFIASQDDAEIGKFLDAHAA